MRAIMIVHAQLTTIVATLIPTVHVMPWTIVRSSTPVELMSPYMATVSGAMRENLPGAAAEQFGIECVPLGTNTAPGVTLGFFTRAARDPDRQLWVFQQPRHRIFDRGRIVGIDE